MTSRTILGLLLCNSLLCLGTLTAGAQQLRNDAPVSANAPTDRPLSVLKTEDDKGLHQLDKVIAPAVKQARRTLPQAKQRFQSGLAAGQAFFLTTRIYDADGRFEQVFVRVREWQGSSIKGIIASDLAVVQQYQTGQLIEFPEKAVLDWTISQPDGSEEGNFVGKLMDTLQ
ncbi:DUF2314 domain-containing protein [Hymenobacter gelipurpurascens]|nr:DUF2314 domain-containing protein [Hymenobacter gelipurpurascens]